jgi:hypothetical protein
LFQIVLLVFCCFSSGITSVTAAPNLTRQNPTKTNYSEFIINGTVANSLFGWEDYSVLAAMLIISCAIGIFYGYFGEKQTTGDDFLLGGSSMGTFPTALSLAAR